MLCKHNRRPTYDPVQAQAKRECPERESDVQSPFAYRGQKEHSGSWQIPSGLGVPRGTRRGSTVASNARTRGSPKPTSGHLRRRGFARCPEVGLGPARRSRNRTIRRIGENRPILRRTKDTRSRQGRGEGHSRTRTRTKPRSSRGQAKLAANTRSSQKDLVSEGGPQRKEGSGL